MVCYIWKPFYFQIDILQLLCLTNEGRSHFVHQYRQRKLQIFMAIDRTLSRLSISECCKEKTISLQGLWIQKLMTGEFQVLRILHGCSPLKKNTCDLGLLRRKNWSTTGRMELADCSVIAQSSSDQWNSRPYQGCLPKIKRKRKCMDTELELWIWDRYEVPWLQTQVRPF